MLGLGPRAEPYGKSASAELLKKCLSMRSDVPDLFLWSVQTVQCSIGKEQRSRLVGAQTKLHQFAMIIIDDRDMLIQEDNNCVVIKLVVLWLVDRGQCRKLRMSRNQVRAVAKACTSACALQTFIGSHAVLKRFYLQIPVLKKIVEWDCVQRFEGAFVKAVPI